MPYSLKRFFCNIHLYIMHLLKTKLNARLAIRQRADLFEFNISAKEISLAQGQSSQCSSGPEEG